MRQIKYLNPIYKFENCTENLDYFASLTVTDANSCYSSDTIYNIQVFCLPDVQITSDQLMCQDDESSFGFNFTNGNSLGVLSTDSLYLWILMVLIH